MLQDLLELLPYLLLVLFLRSILRSFFSNRKRPRPVPPRQAPVSLGGELKKDPVCGTYVPITASLTRNVNGQVLYFCSKECRDRYNP
jgi:YHS domain-containing protein